jgi:hypothetical protein
MMRLPLIAALSALAALASVAPAGASSSQESIFMDDPKIVYSAPENLEGTLSELKRLGADRIRVSVFWHLLAPDPHGESRPFTPGAGADPRSYSAEKWDRYDLIVTTAQRLGLKVLFNLTSPAPNWATPTPPRSDIEDSYRPDPAEFKDFVKAVATRYSGSFADEAPRMGAASLLGACDPTPNFPLPPAVCPATSTDPTPENPNPPNTGPVLPRVDTWSIWNEPNMPGWLTPQSDESNKRLPASPQVYRDLADAMYSGLREADHGSDTILIGETAPRGAFKRAVTQSLAPLLFVRELFCLNRRFKPYSGKAADERGCPSGGDGFAAAHPVLFSATGFAHHPYAFEAPPQASDSTRDHVVLADLGRLTRTLDRAVRRHGSHKRYKIWLSEYGYQTDPPDPYAGWSWKKHARYLAQGDWIAYRNPRVLSTAQFLLYDDAPRLDYAASDPRHWGTFQTGLRTAEGKKKAAYSGYQRTIYVPGSARRGRLIPVFGDYRPATGATPATIQFRRRGASRWTTLFRTTTNGSGLVAVRTKAKRSGEYRIGFGADGQRAYTRAAAVSVRR